MNAALRQLMDARSRSLHGEAEYFPGLAFDRDLERTAADLAVRGELLGGHARVDAKLKALAAEGALDGFGDGHGRKCRRKGL
jgi:hypothetical protein